MPASFQHIPDMHEDMVLMSKSVQGAVNMLRATSSGDEMDINGCHISMLTGRHPLLSTSVATAPLSLYRAARRM